MVKLCNYDEQVHYMLQKTPSHSRDAFSIWEGVAFFMSAVYCGRLRIGH